MKKILCLAAAIVFIISMLCGCGESYICSDCGKNTTKAYYDMSVTSDQVMCEDCAREYWMPLPYQNYRVK